MRLIIKNAIIVDPKGPHHQMTTDLVIENGVIQQSGNITDIKNEDQVYHAENLHVSPGWFDTSVGFGEPGFEERESLANGLKTAALSGFTGVGVQPNTSPVGDHQSIVRFIKDASKNTATETFPIGALTKESLGKDLAELLDMKEAGAVAFGDYQKNISNTNILKIALQYAKDFDALILAFSMDEHLKGKGVVNEGAVSTRLGLKGIPTIAEEIMIARNLKLLEYTGGRLHIPTISTMGSVELIKKAKEKGLKVTCSVAISQLGLNDSELNHFETKYKILPPLRDEETRLALLKAVEENTIDCVTSDHNPIDIEFKKIEFDLAKDGSIGLESVFGVLNSLFKIDTTIHQLISGREVFGLKVPHIAVGQQANLTLFNPEGSWTFEEKHILSKSKNCAFIGKTMKGEVYGVYNNQKLQVQ
jgi:dihydroorotase